MRATPRTLEAYLFALLAHLDRLGASVPTATELRVHATGTMSFDVVAALPDSVGQRPATLRMAEVWEPVAGRRNLERASYTYELVDVARARRRAYHRHDAIWFRSAAEVEVHEHCEEPLGDVRCPHYHGRPVRDGYEAIRLLLIAWTEPGALGCDQLDCIEAA